MSRHLTRWLTGPVFGWHDVGMADIAWALLLSVFGVTSVTGLTEPYEPRRARRRPGRFVDDRAGGVGQASTRRRRRRTGGGGLFELGFL